MRKFLQSLSGEPSPKQPPRERIDIFKALLHDLELITRGEGPRRPDNTIIPAILNRIIKLLLEEEREAETIQEGTAPCIEYFLQSRILELLCSLAAINRPQGMFQWIVNAISRIIQHMKSPLMAHSSMHKPLVRLLSAKPTRLSFEEKIEVIKLITSLAHKLKEAPIFVKLFWTDASRAKVEAQAASAGQPLSSSPIVTNVLHAQQKIASLPVAPKKHFVLFKVLDRIYRGSGGDRRLAEQVRRCILNCIVIDDNYNELQGYLAKQTKFMEFTMNELGKLYATLARETYSGSSNSNGYLQEYFRQLQFCASLCKIDFSRIAEENLRSANATPQPHQQSQTLNRSNPALSGSHSSLPDPAAPAHAEFAQQLSEHMKRLFFVPIILPGLLSDDPKLSNIHTIFSRETLLQLDAPELLGTLITCLVGADEAAAPLVSFGDVPDDPLTETTGHSVQEALISRVEYRPYTYPLDATAKKTAVLAANTLRLFSTLFQFHPHNMYVVNHLLFRNLPLVANPNAHLRAYKHPTEQQEIDPSTYKHNLDQEWPTSPEVTAANCALSFLPPDPPNVGLRFEKLLDLAPLARTNTFISNRPDVQTYHDYVKLRFKLARVHLLTWSSYEGSPEHVFPPPFIPEKKMEHGLQALGLKVLDHESSAETHHIASWRILTPTPRDYNPGKPVTARRLLRALLQNLDHFLELPLDFALYLTDILSSIVQYPHVYIHRWAYHSAPDGESQKALFEIIQGQSARAKAFISESPDRMSKIMHFKEAVEKKEAIDGQYDNNAEERTAEAILLLDEFCKELLADLLLVDQVLN